MAKLLAIYISPNHNFFGHHGKEAGRAPMVLLDEAQCIAGAGIEGDRFFSWKDDYKGQITFFAQESYQALCKRLKIDDRQPDVLRRNIITQGIDLPSLIGRRFRIQNVVFEGSEEAKPCYWMNQAFGEGAEQALSGQGGLRARILEGGTLRTGAAELELLESDTGS